MLEGKSLKTLKYYITLTPDKTYGALTITFKDFPEAITQAIREEDVIHNASDCLEEAIFNRVALGTPLPKPSSGKKNQPFVEILVRARVGGG
jgi:predicted RNase H-like HicB family nuclease